jgi:hypothetical protein
MDNHLLIRVLRCDWIDLESTVTFFGIKGLAKDGRWYHLCEGKKALVFDNPHVRDAKIKEIRKSIKASEQRSETK